MRLPSQEFYEIAFHLSALLRREADIALGMTLFFSAPNEKSFSAERFFVWRRMIWPLLHDSRLKDAHLILQPVNRLSDNGLRVELKDEGAF